MLDNRKSKSFRKTSTSAFLIMPKPLTVCGSQKTKENSRDVNTRPPCLLPEKSE